MPYERSERSACHAGMFEATYAALKKGSLDVKTHESG